MFFDTHAHYDDKAFDGDRAEVLDSIREKGVDFVINPGCTLESSKTAIELAEEYPFIYAAVGIHPEELDDFSADAFEKIEKLAMHPKCAAIGEIGLDYYWDDTRKAEQKELFIIQAQLAAKLDKPVIIHDREAHGDSLEIVKSVKNLRGVFHCYSGSAEMAKELLKMGWYLGFDGPITYKNAKKALEVLEICPLDRMLIETDSPYLSPAPQRGKRNNSANLEYIAAKIAEVKGESFEDICRITEENGKRLFRISDV